MVLWLEISQRWNLRLLRVPSIFKVVQNLTQHWSQSLISFRYPKLTCATIATTLRRSATCCRGTWSLTRRKGLTSVRFAKEVSKPWRRFKITSILTLVQNNSCQFIFLNKYLANINFYDFVFILRFHQSNFRFILFNSIQFIHWSQMHAQQ